MACLMAGLFHLVEQRRVVLGHALLADDGHGAGAGELETVLMDHVNDADEVVFLPPWDLAY